MAYEEENARRTNHRKDNKNEIFSLPRDTVIRPIITYASVIFYNCPKTHFRRLQVLQNKCLRMILSAPFDSRISDLHEKLMIPTIEQFVSKISKNFYEKSRTHENNLISPLGIYSRESLPFRVIHNLPRAI